MHESTLRDFFTGSLGTEQLRDDLVDAVVPIGQRTFRHPVVDMPEDFAVTCAHLVRLCHSHAESVDAVLAGLLKPEQLQPIGFCLIASDHFHWNTNSRDGEIVAETTHDWSSPEINYPLTFTVAKCKLSLRAWCMNVDKVEYHLRVYTEAGEPLEHYGNMDQALAAPRVGERVSFPRKKRAIEVTRVVHEFIEYSTAFTIGYVTNVFGNDVPFEEIPT